MFRAWQSSHETKCKITCLKIALRNVVHELFSADGGEGWWAVLSPSDLDEAFGRGPTSAATADEEVS